MALLAFFSLYTQLMIWACLRNREVYTRRGAGAFCIIGNTYQGSAKMEISMARTWRNGLIACEQGSVSMGANEIMTAR